MKDLGSGGGLRLNVAAEAEGVGLSAHGFDAKGDVFFEGNAKFFSAFDDVFAADASRECLVFEALLD